MMRLGRGPALHGDGDRWIGAWLGRRQYPLQQKGAQGWPVLCVAGLVGYLLGGWWVLHAGSPVRTFVAWLEALLCC
jgi:hypothetical protein